MFVLPHRRKKNDSRDKADDGPRSCVSGRRNRLPSRDDLAEAKKR